MLTISFFLLGVAAWLTAVFGPPFVGLWFWHSARKWLAAWLAHLLFFPAVAITEWLAARAIFFAAHDDGSGPPGLGLFLILPLAVFVGTVIFYYLAVGWAVIRAVWRQRNVR